MKTVPELFGSMVFDDKVMRATLSADVYRNLKDTIRRGKKLDLSVANAVAWRTGRPTLPTGSSRSRESRRKSTTAFSRRRLTAT